METFLSIHQDSIIGTLSTFDRMRFKGHLTGFFPDGAFARFLASQDILLKDFGKYVKQATETLKAQAQNSEESGRPFIYLRSATTKASGRSKEDLARAIAADDRITEGLICVFSVLETCTSFDVRGNRETHKLEVVRRQRKCLHFYFYYIDPEFGFMHVRLQSWFPFEIQICINAREWLARRLDERDIAYVRYENKIIPNGDFATAQELADKLAHRRWPRVLDAFARRVNPHLSTIKQAGVGGYYWVIDQSEYSTDVFFRDQASLNDLAASLMELAMTAFSADDVMRFLGRKLHGNYQGEVITDCKRRPEGRRVKHRMKSNSLKMYNAPCVLRVETTINNPSEFYALRVIQTPTGRSRRWLPMRKGVANIWRYAQVSLQANIRYLNALAHAQPKGKAIAELDRLCRPHTRNGKRYARFNPVAGEDCELFAAVLAGEHALNGFRNKDLQAHLYPSQPASQAEQRQWSRRVTRLIAKLWGHGLIAKVKGSRLYRATARGIRLMSTAIHCRNKEFPGFAFSTA